MRYHQHWVHPEGIVRSWEPYRGPTTVDPPRLKLSSSTASVRDGSVREIESELTPSTCLGGLARSDFTASTEVKGSIHLRRVDPLFDAQVTIYSATKLTKTINVLTLQDSA